MNPNQIDQSLRIIHIWASFEHEQIAARNVHLDNIEQTLKAIANTAAEALDREDLVIK